jgi:hypothetical protein
MRRRRMSSELNARCWRCLACCAALSACNGAAADEAPMRCELDNPPGQILGNRSGTIASLERLPESCLKTLLLACSQHADQQFMDLGSAAMCSMGYEALLRKTFGGDFHAFMEWWRRERKQALRD